MNSQGAGRMIGQMKDPRSKGLSPADRLILMKESAKTVFAMVQSGLITKTQAVEMLNQINKDAK